MTTHIPHLKTDTSEGYSNYIHEKIKEVKETMPIQYWHESNQFCRDWWDSIEENDYMAFAKVKLGCVEIEARIDRYNSAVTTISYYLNVRNKNMEWEESDCIIPDHIEFISRITTWNELFNDMIYTLIEHCIEYEIDYEAKYWCMKSHIINEVADKLLAEFSSYIKSITERNDAIQSHYKITMMNEFKIAILEMCKDMKPKDIRVNFIEPENILSNLFNEFIKKDTGEMDIYKEFILNTIKEEK